MFTILVAGIFVAYFIWNIYYKKKWYENLKVTLNFSNESIYAGEKTKLVEVVENRKKMPIPLLEVGFHTKRDLLFQNEDNTYITDNTYKRDIFACLGKQKITRQIEVKGKRRGYYEIDKIDVTSFSLLHEQRLSKTIDSDARIYVYPARVKVDDILVICKRMSGNIQCTKNLYEDPFAFSSIREYTIADPMKTINWKASARTGSLMVNTFDSEMTQKAFIFLDLEDSSILKHEHLIEYSISLVASLGYKLLTNNMELGIESNCNISLEQTGGKKQLSRLERMLALYSEENNNIAAIIDIIENNRQQFKKENDTIFIFISKNASKELAAAIKSFIGDKRQGIWICPYTSGDDNEKNNIDSIREVLKVPNFKIIAKEVSKY